MAVAPTAANTAALHTAIAQLAPNQTVQQALLVGSYGESGWDPNAVGSGGYGAFGFTSSQYTDPTSPTYVAPGAPPDQQVAAILPAYEAAAAHVPSHLTGPARAEWIALGAERPLGYQSEQAQIEATNAPTTYGANTSYQVQNWGHISGIVTSQPAQGSAPSATSGSLMGPCDKAKCLLTFPLAGCLLDQCQAKAIVSGLLMVGGGLVVLVGVAVLASSSSTGKQLMKLAPVGYGVSKLTKANPKVSEQTTQRREAAAYNQGHAEGKTMASQGSSVPKGSSYKPRPEDADFAVEAA